METFELNATVRPSVGKSASRRLRRMGKLPGIVYGAGKEPVAITLGHDDVLHHLEHEAFFSHILTLNIEGEKEQVVLKDVHRHPWRPKLLHLDLLRIDKADKIVMNVPLHFINETSCLGVKEQGGVISHILTELEISCLPGDLPEYIEVDMQQITVGQTVHLGDIKLPARVQSASLLHGGDPAQPVVSVHLPRVSAIDTEQEAADAGEEGGEVESSDTGAGA